MHKLGDVVMVELKFLNREKMFDVLYITGKEIVHTNNFISLF